MLVIGFTGFARSGKDTAATYFLGQENYVKYSFAYPIKEMLRIGFGLTESELEGGNKEEPLTRLGLDKSPRQLMQTMGTEWGRVMIDSEVWLKLAQRNWELLRDNGKNMIITDVRFENEAQWVKSIGGIITKVTREGVKAANQDEHVQSALIEKHVDLHIMWPTYKPGDIKESHTLLKPVLKKNFRNYVEY